MHKEKSRTVSIEEAAKALGIGRSLAYELARRGQFPVKVLAIGVKPLYKVPRVELDKVLGGADTATEA